MAAGERWGKTHAVTAAIAVMTVLVAAVGWTRSWGPDARARRVAETMSGTLHPSRSWADSLLDLWAKSMTEGTATARAEWTALELGRLAKDHPRSLARAAAGVSSRDVRFVFLDVIDRTDAYADVPASMRLEHVATHAVFRHDRKGAEPLTDAEIDALRSDPGEAVRALRNALGAGHCGALAGYEALGQKPDPRILIAAAETIARSSASPMLSDLDPESLDHCRARIAALAAPTTDGSANVVPAPMGAR